MGRTAVTCMVLAATVGILAGANDTRAAASPGAPWRAREATKTVRFDGYTFRVPAGWPVYRLGRGSTRCVRYDINAVYLGPPGVNQQCPAQRVGQADTVSITASGTAGQHGSPAIELQSAEVGGPAPAPPAQAGKATPRARAGKATPAAPEAPAGPHPGLSVTATYGTDPAVVQQILSSARDTRTGAPVAVRQAALAHGGSPSAAAAGSPVPSPPAAASGNPARRPASPSASVTPAPSAPGPTAPAPQVPGATPTGSAPTPTAPAPTPTGPAPTPTGPAPTPTGPAPTPTAPASTAAAPGSQAPAATPSPGLAPTASLATRNPAPLPGFDTCTAPSVQAMRAWRRSYSAAAIYIGGPEMACDYGNLSASWIRAVKAMGWSLIPVYVGLQAPCTSFSQKIQPSHAAPEGTSSAEDAVFDAQWFGLGKRTPIYFDMEAYHGRNSQCRDSVLSFLNAWTRKLHARGYLSGVYSSASSGAEDLGSATSVYGRRLAKPNAIWFALWDKQANVSGTPYLLPWWWSPGRRIKQYEGARWVKIGGVKLDIDSDWVQGPVY